MSRGVKEIKYPNLELSIMRAKISRDDISFYTGMDKSTLSAKMTGKRDFKLSEAVQIQELLEARLDEFLTIDFLFQK